MRTEAEQRDDELPDDGFWPNRNHDMARRSAMLLDWAAEVRPGLIIPYERIAERCLRLNFPLAPNATLTMAVFEGISLCRPILVEEYGRDLITTAEGARATISGEEVFRSVLGDDLKSVMRSVDRYLDTARLVRRQGADAKPLRHVEVAQNVITSVAAPLGDLFEEWAKLAGRTELLPAADPVGLFPGSFPLEKGVGYDEAADDPNFDPHARYERDVREATQFE